MAVFSCLCSISVHVAAPIQQVFLKFNRGGLQIIPSHAIIRTIRSGLQQSGCIAQTDMVRRFRSGGTGGKPNEYRKAITNERMTLRDTGQCSIQLRAGAARRPFHACAVSAGHQYFVKENERYE